MKIKKDLPTLNDSDIVTNQEAKKSIKINPMKMSTIAMALAMTTASGSMLNSCSDSVDCDSDTTTVADPSADAGVGADIGTYADVTDVDVSNTQDYTCD